jgi:DNA-binding transcriptional MerR regulator
MNDGEALYSIGDLARRTGLTVKAIRSYADRGIVPPTDRSPAGYRRYDSDAVARLCLVRTLRELGLDLPTVRKVVDQEVSLPEIAAVHADALEVQIRTLRLRHAVLTAVARRGSTPEETDLMHRLAKLSEDERRRLIGDFLDTVFGTAGADPWLAAVVRSMTPELPEDPTAEQAEAWLELAELSQDPGFRACVKLLVERYVADRARAGTRGPRRDAAAAIRDQVGAALAAGVEPTSPEADPFVAGITADYAHVFAAPAGDLDLRSGLLAWLETVNDPRRELYHRLLAVINGWSAPESSAPQFDWFIQALRARVPA